MARKQRNEHSEFSKLAAVKQCVNHHCEHVIPICEQCNADMVLRKGAQGEFWGCSNYNGNEELSCRNSKNVANIYLK